MDHPLEHLDAVVDPDTAGYCAILFDWVVLHDRVVLHDQKVLLDWAVFYL